MLNISFITIPIQYEEMKNKISDTLSNLYAQFNFYYFPCSTFLNQNDISSDIKEKQNKIKDFLFENFKDFKFLTYHFNNSDIGAKQPNTSQIINVINCVEGNCIIIEQINIEMINDVIEKLKKQKISVLNLTQNRSNKEKTNDELMAIEEIGKFISKFENKIEANNFLKLTIFSIAGFLIRRFYFPTSYFKNPSFFIFKQQNDKLMIQKLIYSANNSSLNIDLKTLNDSLNYLSKNDNNKYVFREDEFIELRDIYKTTNYSLKLVIHRETLFICLMKLIPENITPNDKEVNFCQNFSGFEFMHFYGFVKNNNQIIGFIYEFMSNGNLNSYILSNKEQIDEPFLLLTIIRIFKGIQFLQSNNLIHRDLKPSNILLDHDFLPFISDFETIRSISKCDDDSSKFTVDIGSNAYASPEQLDGNMISFPTDIYSFGKIIYFLYEKKSLISENNIKMKNGSVNIQNLCMNCLKTNPNERPKCNDIKLILNNEIISFSFEKYYIDCEILTKQPEFVFISFFYSNFLDNDHKYQFIKKCTNFLLFLKNSECIEKDCQIHSIDISEALCEIGTRFLIIEKETTECYSQAKLYFEKAAKKNNSEALNNLGYMYLNGIGVKKNYYIALGYFKKSVEQNYSSAFYNIGIMYFNGLVFEQSYNTALKYFIKSAEQSNSKALNDLGAMYFNGLGVEPNYNTALKYFKRSAKQNNSEAFNEVGYMYLNGIGVKKDYNEALGYFKKSVEQNYSSAFYNIGIMYFIGLGVEQSYNTALKYYEKSAEQNNSDALNDLGVMYFNGLGVEPNYNTALKYFEKSAEQNNSKALSNLGIIYFNGLGVEQDYNKALEYFEKSARQNNSDAINFLGAMYFNGLGVEINYNKALKYFEKSAEQNNLKALNMSGNMYFIGIGAKQNYQKSLKYFEKAAEQNSSEAFNMLGIMYFSGFGVKKDYNTALEYFGKAAEQNYPSSWFYLGKIHYFGYGVQRNYIIAEKYFQLSAKYYNSDALYYLGLIYYSGLDIKQDLLKAKYYFELSAKNNNECAIYSLGMLYHYGHGVEQNFQKAKEYYELSAKQNHWPANFQLGFLYQHGQGVEKNFKIAIEYYKLVLKQTEDPKTLVNLGSIYFEGYKNVIRDYSQAAYWFERAAKQGNSIGFFNLGHMYLNGIGVKQNYNEALRYFEESAKLGNSEAYLKLGLIYYNGCGVQINYTKAKSYFEISSYQNNSSAYLCLGNMYYNGNGVNRDYQKAKKFYEYAAQLNEPAALFYLGNMYSDKFPFIMGNYKKSIEYYKRCIEIEKVCYSCNYNSTKNPCISSVFNNEYRYLSYNNLGLLYLLEYKNINECEKYIKEGAYGEFSYAQNNFGLLNQFFFNNSANAEYMYERASKNYFALSVFNLGYLREKENNIDKSISYYEKASDFESIPLKFRSISYSDLKLEVSKIFIICNANLKLVSHYFSLCKFQESKKFFIRSISKIYSILRILGSLKNLQLSGKKNNNFSFLRKFILGFPLFNLKMQPKLNKNLDPDIFNYFPSFETKPKPKLNNDDNISKSNNLKNNIKKDIDDKKNRVMKSKTTNPEEEEDNENPKNEKEDKDEFTDHKMIDKFLDDPGKFFDYIIEDEEKRKNFIDEINKIIEIMQSILYTPPYSILFGRIKIMPNLFTLEFIKEDINEEFYEGFGI